LQRLAARPHTLAPFFYRSDLHDHLDFFFLFLYLGVNLDYDWTTWWQLKRGGKRYRDQTSFKNNILMNAICFFSNG